VLRVICTVNRAVQPEAAVVRVDVVVRVEPRRFYEGVAPLLREGMIRKHAVTLPHVRTESNFIFGMASLYHLLGPFHWIAHYAQLGLMTEMHIVLTSTE